MVLINAARLDFDNALDLSKLAAVADAQKQAGAICFQLGRFMRCIEVFQLMGFTGVDGVDIRRMSCNHSRVDIGFMSCNYRDPKPETFPNP